MKGRGGCGRANSKEELGIGEGELRGGRVESEGGGVKCEGRRGVESDDTNANTRIGWI